MSKLKMKEKKKKNEKKPEKVTATEQNGPGTDKCVLQFFKG